MAGSTAQLNGFGFNTTRLNNGTNLPVSFRTEMRRLQDSKPLIKVEFIDISNVATDISSYYLEGARFEQIKERAPDEIHAGNFDIVLANHDDYFSEYNASSLLYQIQYHGAKIRVSLGFVLPDGSTSYETQATGIIDQLTADGKQSFVTVRCRDAIKIILDTNLNPRQTGQVAAFGSSNVGTGGISSIETKPFKTVNEDWTLTCTLAGGDSTATFSVIGSVSGNVGTATSGTEFSTGSGAGGIKFTVTAGGVNWALNDTITFTTYQYPEWSALNPGKIIWSVLTGYDWDTDTQENFSGSVLALDSTQSDANTDIDYNAFSSAISSLESSQDISAFVQYNQNAADFIENIQITFLGSLYTDSDGRITLQSWVPLFGGDYPPSYSDAKKIQVLGYTRTIDEVINYFSGRYKRTNEWEFSDADITYNGLIVVEDTTSEGKYGILPFTISLPYFSATGGFIENLGNRLIAKYSEPPLSIDLITGLDAAREEIGNKITVTDTKYGFSGLNVEIARIEKLFDAQPKQIGMRVKVDLEVGVVYGFLGSSADEGDGLSPQAGTYASATTSDKRFLYIGSESDSTPDYRMF